MGASCKRTILSQILKNNFNASVLSACRTVSYAQIQQLGSVFSAPAPCCLRLNLHNMQEQSNNKILNLHLK